MRKWRHVQGYEGYYLVSNDGKVKTFERHWPSFVKEKILSPSKNRGGYLHVNLRKDGRTKSIGIHRLVAVAFVPNPDNKPEVDHIDGDPSNNHDWNLRWVTRMENMHNPITEKRMEQAYDRRRKKIRVQ